MARSRIVRICAVIVLVLTLLIVAVVPSSAHWDKPGPPPLRVVVTLDNITYFVDLDDWSGNPLEWDPEAEVFVAWSISQKKHLPGDDACTCMKVGNVSNMHFDMDGAPRTWSLGKQVYICDECTPEEPIYINFQFAELDNGGISNNIISALGKLAEVVKPAKTPLIEAIMALITALLQSLNSDDYLGSVEYSPPLGNYTGNGNFTAAGTNYGNVSYTIEVKELSVTPPPCSGNATATCFVSDDIYSLSHAYDGCNDAISLTQNAQFEEGAGLTPEQKQADIDTGVDTILDGVDLVTADLVQRISFDPVAYSEATLYLDEARYARSQSLIDAAIYKYKMAGLSSMEALVADNSCSVSIATGPNVTANLPCGDVAFTDVIAEGTASCTTSASAPCGPLPSPYTPIGSPLHFTTTATYSGPVTVDLTYNDSGIPTEGDLRLFHCDGAGWNDVTTSLDTANNVISGEDAALSWWQIGDPPSGGGGGGGGGLPLFPNIYIGIAAGLGAGILAYLVHRRIVQQR